jgi:Na+/H+ antiporter NhaD/arsenite permease-like protein
MNRYFLLLFFWFSVAFLINFSGNFLLFVYSETSNKDVDFKINYAIIYSTVTIIKNILLCVAVTMKETITTKISNKLQPDIELTIFNPDKPESY